MNGLNNIPTWAKVVSLVGFPIVVALYFMARESGTIGSPATEAASTIAVHAEASMVHDRKLDNLGERITTGLRVICENSTKDRASLNNCANIR